MGDLISRETLLEKTKTIYTEADGVLVTASVVTRTDIVMAPAVDAEPVRRGTWKMCRSTLKTDFATITGTYPTCSLCGHTEYGVDKSTPYCPGCGAKMGGDSE